MCDLRLPSGDLVYDRARKRVAKQPVHVVAYLWRGRRVDKERWIYMRDTFTYVIHLHTRYIHMRDTYTYAKHLHARYIYIRDIFTCAIHVHTRYKYIRMRPAHRVLERLLVNVQFRTAEIRPEAVGHLCPYSTHNCTHIFEKARACEVW